MSIHKFRCGDTARIEGTDYEIEVAYADYESGRASWFGWPEGTVEIEKLTLVKACSNEGHKAAVAQWLDHPRNSDTDHRRGAIERLYRPRAYWRKVCAVIEERIQGDHASLARASVQLIRADAGPEDA